MLGDPQKCTFQNTFSALYGHDEAAHHFKIFEKLLLGFFFNCKTVVFIPQIFSALFQIA